MRLVTVADPMAPPLARLDSRVHPRDIVELRNEPFRQDADGREGTSQDGADVLSGWNASPLVGAAPLGLIGVEQFDRFDRAPCQEDLQHGNDMQKDLRLEVVLRGRCGSILYTCRAGLRRHGRAILAATERRARHARVPERREGGRDDLDHSVRDEQAFGDDGAEEVQQSQRDRRQLGEPAGEWGVSLLSRSTEPRMKDSLLLREEDAVEGDEGSLEPLGIVAVWLSSIGRKPPSDGLAERDAQVGLGRRKGRTHTQRAIVVVNRRERVRCVLRKDGELVRGITCVALSRSVSTETVCESELN